MSSIVVVFLCTEAPSSAGELAFQWSFVTDVGSPGPPSGLGQIVRGTISGLVEGNNDYDDGLTVTITQTPSGDLLGTDRWVLVDIVRGGIEIETGPAFVVSSGEVIHANAHFLLSKKKVGPFPSFAFLNMGTDPNYETAWHPSLSDSGVVQHRWSNSSGGVTNFIAIIPEPSCCTLARVGIALVCGFRNAFPCRDRQQNP